MRRTGSRAVWFALLMAVAVSGLCAQDTRGTIVGAAVDPTGAVIPNVKVTATNLSTGTATSGMTNEKGEYFIPYLLPGTYSVAAEGPGFKAFLRSGIELRTGDRPRIDITMELGQQSERVTVSAGTPLLETTTSSVGQVIERRWLNDLPILHDNPVLLTALTPGVTNTNANYTFQGTSPSAPGAYVYALGGSPSASQEITMDGASNTSTLAGNGTRGIAFIPPADVVGEFKVQTAGFDASVGNSTGGAVSLSLKSGTNTFHGTVSYARTNVGWNANDFFANRVGQPRPALRTNHEVITASGPIVLPKLYRGTNKTFFIYAWEREPRSVPFGYGTFTVPTEKERQGDFSDLLKVGPNYQIYDPFSAALVNGRVTRTPVPNNILSPSRMNPVATKILSYYPLPTVSGLANGTLNYPLPNLLSIVSYNTHIGRIDHNINDRFRIFLRGNWGERPALQQDYFNNAATGLFAGQLQRGIHLDTVYTFSPNVILNVRYSYTRWIADNASKSRGMDISTLGFPTSLSAPLGPKSGFPSIAISSLLAIGYGGGGSYTATNTHDLAGQVNWARGKHILTMGVEARNYMLNALNFQNSPRFTFSTNYTQGPVYNSPSSPGGVGQGLAGFLLGIPTSGSINVTSDSATSSPHVSLFLQDDWRARSNLTVNAGIRYEAEGGLSERFDRSVRGFDTNTINSLNTQVKANYAKAPIPELPVDQFAVKGGLLFAGANGQPHALYNTPRKNFAPRIGLAYTATKNTVLRAAYGVFFGFIGQQANTGLIQSGFTQATSFVPTLDGGLTFAANLTNPFPNGVTQPTAASAGLNTYLGNGISFFNSNPSTPYFQIWSLMVQRALPGRLFFEVGYMGNRGAHLRIPRALQFLDSKYLSRLPVRDEAANDYWTAQLPNPFYPLLPGTGLASRVVSRARLAEMANYPQFTSVSTTDNEGLSWYHGLTARIQKRFGTGFTMQLNYTRSKLLTAVGRLNGQDSPLERVVSANDRPYSLAFNAIYELPFGPGKQVPVENRVAREIARNWQIGAVLTAQGGPPLGFGNALLTGNLSDIALPGSERSIYRWFNTGVFNRNSREQLTYNYRTLSSLLSGVRGPGMNIWNLCLIRTIRLRERLGVRLKADLENAFNHPNFAVPNTSPTSASFGMITNTTASARIIQLGAKVQW